MKPVHTADCDVVYKSKEQDIGDLRCHRVRPHHIRTTWELSDEERELLANGGRIRLHILKEPIPPVMLEVVTAEDSEPVGQHGWKIDVEPGEVLKEKEEAGTNGQ